MQELSDEIYGNPSSTHSIGRKARTIIEQARKDIAGLIGAHSSEIIFTSGGTEADNIFLQGISAQIDHVICSPIEHPAVLNTLKELQIDGPEISWLTVNKNGEIDYDEVEEMLNTYPESLLVVMHGNNEIGNLTDLTQLAESARLHKGLLFSDAVQTIGHYKIDLSNIDIAGLAASAHKFHGPKGVGFLYLKKGTRLHNIYSGGEQEKGLRSGTENVAGIAGMAKALQICYTDLSESQARIRELKEYLRQALADFMPAIEFNGSANADRTMNNVLSVSFPAHVENEMLQFNLDLAGIAVSAGSACASGAVKESHVMEAIQHEKDRAVIRFSLSRFTSKEEIDLAITKVREIYS